MKGDDVASSSEQDSPSSSSKKDADDVRFRNRTTFFLETRKIARKQKKMSLEEWRSRALRAEEELQLTKALLLLRNIDVKINLNENDVQEKDPTPEVVKFNGDAKLLKELMKVRGKLQLLQDCCRSLRKEVNVLHMTIPQTSQWVLTAAQIRLRHEVRTRQLLEKRLEKLAKLLK
jgi:hypothetical protein